MEPRDRDDLLATLKSVETCEQGTFLIYQKADAIDVETAEAIRKESLRPEPGNRAAWFAEWYGDAQGAVFISQCLAAIAVAGDPRFSVHQYLEEQKRLDRGVDPEILHRAAKILLAFAPKTMGAMNTLVSRADAIVSGSRAVDAARKKREFEGVEIAALIGVDGARDLVGEIQREFDGHLSAISGFVRLAGDLARETENRDDMREVLSLQGTLVLLQREMAHLSGQADGLDAWNERAREKLTESLAVADRPADRARCLSSSLILKRCWRGSDG